MKISLLKLAVLSALTISTQAFATGLVGLPAAGFASSAYTNCFNDGRTSGDPKGNFGSYSPWSVPSTTVNNTCWVAKPSTEIVAPLSGYTLVGSRSVSIPRATGDSTVTIGTLLDYAWRNSSTGMCIIGTRVTMTNADHDAATTGTQYFEINDIARGGFSGLGTVNAGYTLFASTASPVFRAGRTFTSVQHRALAYDNSTNKALNGTNYLDLPTKNSVTASITGENSPIASTTTASTTSATQDAVVNDSWVDFTLDVAYLDDDGGSNAVSAFTYVQAACSANPTVITNGGAIRLRQTAQEYANFKEIIMDGYSIGTP
jgi:hypothetical protein